MEKSIVSKIAKLLVLIGALNWGLVGVGAFINTNLNVVELLLGNWPTVVAVVYVLVGLSALYDLFLGKR